MKCVVLIAASLIVGSAVGQAATYDCNGAGSLKGKMSFRSNKKNGTVHIRGTYQFTDERDQPEVIFECDAELNNDGQSAIKTFDYYETKKTTDCAVDYIRVSHEMKVLGNRVDPKNHDDDHNVDLSFRGRSDHDTPGYGYAPFLCE